MSSLGILPGETLANTSASDLALAALDCRRNCGNAHRVFSLETDRSLCRVSHRFQDGAKNRDSCEAGCLQDVLRPVECRDQENNADEHRDNNRVRLRVLRGRLVDLDCEQDGHHNEDHNQKPENDAVVQDIELTHHFCLCHMSDEYIDQLGLGFADLKQNSIDFNFGFSVKFLHFRIVQDQDAIANAL